MMADFVRHDCGEHVHVDEWDEHVALCEWPLVAAHPNGIRLSSRDEKSIADAVVTAFVRKSHDSGSA